MAIYISPEKVGKIFTVYEKLWTTRQVTIREINQSPSPIDFNL